MALNPEFCRACLKTNINQKARRKTQDPCKLLLHAISTCYLCFCPKLIKGSSCPILQTAPALRSCCWGSAPHIQPHTPLDSTSCSTCTSPRSHDAMYETPSDSSPTAIANIKENSNQYTQSLFIIHPPPRIISHMGFRLPRTVQEVVGST